MVLEVLEILVPRVRSTESLLQYIKAVVLLLRPHQWVKNLFVFLPIFFDRHLFELEYWWPTAVAFVAFSLVASAVYCFNDIHDAPFDQLHPVKKLRPIASGQVSPAAGYVMCTLCVAAGGALLAAFVPSTASAGVAGVLSAYLALNVAYCMKLKHYAIVDVFIIASGFVLRLFAGAFASGVPLSHWIVLMTFLLALFLAFAKRRDDVVSYENTGVLARRNINRYNVAFMNQALSVIAAVTLVAYILYCVSPGVIHRMGSDQLYLTSVFVLAGIIRYLQLSIVDLKSGSPTKVLLRDHFIQGCVALWLGTFLVLLY